MTAYCAGLCYRLNTMDKGTVLHREVGGEKKGKTRGKGQRKTGRVNDDRKERRKQRKQGK